MKKILVAYVSRTGNTEKMAEFIAEGVRLAEEITKMVEEVRELGPLHWPMLKSGNGHPVAPELKAEEVKA